jgi:hypothetical protein
MFMCPICLRTLNNQRNIKSGLSENCSEMRPTTQGGEKRKRGTMNEIMLDHYITEILNDYRSGDINKKQAIEDIMSYGFTKKHAKAILEGK